MTTPNSNQVSFLRTSRTFPEDSQALSVELDRSYLDIANAVNVRTIGLFTNHKPSNTGEGFFLGKGRQQTSRQVYMFTSSGSIDHGINFLSIAGFTRIYGTFTNGTNWYPLPYVDVVNANNQVNVIVTPTNIVITAGGGSPPAITSGFVIIEWLNNP